MQIFVPYQSPLECAKALWNDSKRYNKQIIECRQILNAIYGTKAWANHPVTKMYREHKEWLYNYMMCFSAYRDFKKGNSKAFMYYCYFDNQANKITPPFLTEEFCDQHKRRLYTKSKEKYPQFAKYGKSDENWYFVDGRIVKYINGKKL